MGTGDEVLRTTVFWDVGCWETSGWSSGIQVKEITSQTLSLYSTPFCSRACTKFTRYITFCGFFWLKYIHSISSPAVSHSSTYPTVISLQSLPLLSWLLVVKMNRSSWQRRKSLSSSRSSMRFCSHEFFSREICSWARRLEINRYGLQGGVCPDALSVQRTNRDAIISAAPGL